MTKSSKFFGGMTTFLKKMKVSMKNTINQKKEEGETSNLRCIGESCAARNIGPFMSCPQCEEIFCCECIIMECIDFNGKCSSRACNRIGKEKTRNVVVEQLGGDISSIVMLYV